MFQAASNAAPAMDFKEYSAHWVEQPPPEELAAAIHKFSPDSECIDGREIAMAALAIIGEAIPLFEAGKNREEVIAHLASKGLERDCAEPVVDKAKSILDDAENEDGTASIAPQPSSSPWKLGKWIAAAIFTIGVIDFFRTPPIEQQGCDYSDVTLQVRELIAYRISEIASPAKDKSRATDQVQLINPDSVRQQDIYSRSTPRENRERDIFYSCSASASIELAPTLHDRLSQSPFASVVLHADRYL